MMPGANGSNEWTIVINFRSADDLAAWQQSKEHAEIIAEGFPFSRAATSAKSRRVAKRAVQPLGDVTEVIFSRIKPGMEDAYREWTTRIEAAQARYPGYRGTFLQPPDEKGGMWSTIIRFKSAPQLEAWMDAPERKSLLQESKEFIEHEQLTRLATAFPGMGADRSANRQRPAELEDRHACSAWAFSSRDARASFSYSDTDRSRTPRVLATFIGNALSVAATSFITMPLFVRWFGWWLFPDDASTLARHVERRGHSHRSFRPRGGRAVATAALVNRNDEVENRSADWRRVGAVTHLPRATRGRNVAEYREKKRDAYVCGEIHETGDRDIADCRDEASVTFIFP